MVKICPFGIRTLPLRSARLGADHIALNQPPPDIGAANLSIYECWPVLPMLDGAGDRDETRRGPGISHRPMNERAG